MSKRCHTKQTYLDLKYLNNEILKALYGRHLVSSGREFQSVNALLLYTSDYDSDSDYDLLSSENQPLRSCMNGLKPFERTTVTILPSPKTITAHAMMTKRIPSLRELLHYRKIVVLDVLFFLLE